VQAVAIDGGPVALRLLADRRDELAGARTRTVNRLHQLLHLTEQYANNCVEADHGRLKARLRPMRGLKRLRSAAVIATGHAFVQNLRRGHYELATDAPPLQRLTAALVELTLAI